MQALNSRDVAIDCAFMETVEGFMRHGREDVPDYRLFEKMYTNFMKMQAAHQAKGEWMDSPRPVALRADSTV